MDPKEERRRRKLRMIGAIFALMAIALLVIAPQVEWLLKIALVIGIIFLAITGIFLLVCPDALDEFRDKP